MENISFFIIDIFIVFVILFSLIIGWIRGATKEILSVAAWGGSIYMAMVLFPYVKDITRSYINHGLIADFTTICILFVLFLTLLSVINYVCSNFIKKSVLNTTDKALGGIFGIFRGGIILAILDFTITQCFMSEIPQIIKNSQIRPYIANVSNYILLVLPDNIQEKIISHLSQTNRQNILEFLKDDIFEKNDIDSKEIFELAEPITSIEESSDNELNKTQSAESLATLKPKKKTEDKSLKKTKTQEQKERLDMDRLLDQYDNVDEE